MLVGLALALATAAAAQPTTVADLDGDGIDNAVDRCPDSDVHDVVAEDGCAACACEADASGAPWASRRDYARCVVDAVRSQRRDGALSWREARAAKRAARKSTCGDPSLIRCCMFRDFDDEIGTCRLMSEDECDAMDDRLWEHEGEADDEGPGSCLPNPCEW